PPTRLPSPQVGARSTQKECFGTHTTFLATISREFAPRNGYSYELRGTSNSRSRRQAMLSSGKMVGFIPTKDYDKARAFYEGKLGFEFVSLDKFALVMSVGGHMIRIVKIQNFTPLQGTILGWQVEDIQSVAIWLRDRGVPPEKYPFAQDQNLGIWTTPDGSKVAWF